MIFENILCRGQHGAHQEEAGAHEEPGSHQEPEAQEEGEGCPIQLWRTLVHKPASELQGLKSAGEQSTGSQERWATERRASERKATEQGASKAEGLRARRCGEAGTVS